MGIELAFLCGVLGLTQTNGQSFFYPYQFQNSILSPADGNILQSLRLLNKVITNPYSSTTHQRLHTESKTKAPSGPRDDTPRIDGDPYKPFDFTSDEFDEAERMADERLYRPPLIESPTTPLPYTATSAKETKTLLEKNLVRELETLKADMEKVVSDIGHVLEENSPAEETGKTPASHTKTESATSHDKVKTKKKDSANPRKMTPEDFIFSQLFN